MTVRVLLAIILYTILTSCTGLGSGTTSDDPPASPVSLLPNEPSAIVGTITRAQDNSVLVEERPGENMGGRKIMFTLTAATRTFARRGQDLHAITAADLAAGSQVEAWADGAIAESYPEQARAATIVVTNATASSKAP